MPSVEIDGTNSTVKTNVLTSQSASAITVPTGKVLTVTDAAGLTVAGSTVGALDTAAVATAATAAAQYAIATQVPPSTSGKVLTSNGSAWTSATPAGGAKFTPLAQIPSSNLGVVEFDSTWITSTYDVYFIAMIGIVPAGDAGAIQAWVQQGGSRAGGSNYEYGYDGFKSSGSSSTGYNTGRSHWEIIEKVGYGSGESMSGGMWLWEPLAAGRYTTLTWQVGGYSSIPDVRVATGAGVYKSGTAVNGIEFTSSAGNFAGGQWRLYGVEKT